MIRHEFNKKKPFLEDEEYVKKLIEKATENAITMSSKPTGHLQAFRVAISVAASVVLLFGVASAYRDNEAEKQEIKKYEEQDPLGKFLNSITKEEAKQIQYYEVE